METAIKVFLAAVLGTAVAMTAKRSRGFGP